MDPKAMGPKNRSQVTVEEAQIRATQGSAAILDVREPDEWAAGHIPGAIHIPLGELEQRLGELSQDRPLVAACRSGSRSARATKFLQGRGYEVANLVGGMKSWQRSRLPIEPSAGRVL